MTKFEIHQFICRTDNYGVLVSDADTGLTMSVDAPDAKRIDEELEKKKLNLTHLLITHKHQDHIDGIEYLKNKYNCIVLGPESEKDQIPHLDITLIGDEYIDFSGSPIRVIETPGHTLGHIVFFLKERKFYLLVIHYFLWVAAEFLKEPTSRCLSQSKKLGIYPLIQSYIVDTSTLWQMQNLPYQFIQIMKILVIDMSIYKKLSQKISAVCPQL